MLFIFILFLTCESKRKETLRNKEKIYEKQRKKKSKCKSLQTREILIHLRFEIRRSKVKQNKKNQKEII